MAINTFLEKQFHGLVKFFSGLEIISIKGATPLKIIDGNIDDHGIAGDISSGEPFNFISYYEGTRGNWWGTVQSVINSVGYNELTPFQRLACYASTLNFSSNITTPREMVGYLAGVDVSPNAGSGAKVWGFATELSHSGSIDIAELIGFKVNANTTTGTGDITTGTGFYSVKPIGNSSGRFVNFRGFYSDLTSPTTYISGDAYHFYGEGDAPSFFGGTVQADKGFISTAVTLEATSTEITTNTIVAGINSVDVGSVDTNADDFIVLPALADVEIGHTIKIACNAGSAFEMRTPATSGEKINTVDSDGTNEYLCTDTELITVTKVSDADGWVATAQTALGAIAVAVVPDNV